MKTVTLSMLFILAACNTGIAESESTDRSLIRALQDGGFNIYFRHAQTDWSQNDQVSKAGDWTSCDAIKMRQLSDSGRQTSKAIGTAIRALGVPVELVLASPYCRTRETATLLGLGPVKTTTDIMNLRSADYFGGRNAVLSRARARLAEKPPPGTNIVLVGHGNVAREATPVYPGEAEAVLFLPDGKGGFSFVARLTLERWIELKEKAQSIPQTE